MLKFDDFLLEFREYLQGVEKTWRFADVYHMLHVLQVNQFFLHVTQVRKYMKTYDYM